MVDRELGIVLTRERVNIEGERGCKNNSVCKVQCRE
jgi:hypothetical protein